MKKVSFIASTLLTSTMLLTTTQSVEAHTADLVTKENAKQIATEALSNSGGNPNLQRLGRTVDKGAYFEIISHNRLNEGSGMYKVYKNGEVEYKMVHIVTLINFKIHVFMQNQVSLKLLKHLPLLMINKLILLIVHVNSIVIM